LGLALYTDIPIIKSNTKENAKYKFEEALPNKHVDIKVVIVVRATYRLN
jgi:hypothetical protein